MRALGDREEQNIRDLKLDEAVADCLKAVDYGQPLSPNGLSLASFGSLGRTSPVPTGSS